MRLRSRNKGEYTVGQTYTMNDASIVREIRDQVGGLSQDEAALVRMLTPRGLVPPAQAEHTLEMVDLIETIRADEATADYVFAIAPDWDGTIETLLLGAKVTTLFANQQIDFPPLLPAA